MVARTIEKVSPGHGAGDALANAVTGPSSSERAGELALALGLLFAVVSLVTAMAQVERGANRIYGIRRDRPALEKYGRAAVLTAVLAAPVGIGFLLLVAGGAFADAMPDLRVVRWHRAGLAPRALAGGDRAARVRDRGPARPLPPPPPARPVLAGPRVGGRRRAHDPGHRRPRGVRPRQLVVRKTYGPLAGIIALLLWSLLSAIALFYGVAVCAQLEALRAGEHRTGVRRPGRPHGQPVDR